jgi:hypothetical protein
MGLDPNKPGDRKRIATIIKTWISNGVLAVEKRKDENRHDREFIVPGSWKEGASVDENN